MRNLKTLLLSLAMIFSSVGFAKSQSATSRYLNAFGGPLAHVSKALVSIPAGFVGGMETTIKSKAQDFRVFHGLGYGVLGTVKGAVATALSPISLTRNIYRAITGKKVKQRNLKYVLKLDTIMDLKLMLILNMYQVMILTMMTYHLNHMHL